MKHQIIIKQKSQEIQIMEMQFKISTMMIQIEKMQKEFTDFQQTVIKAMEAIDRNFEKVTKMK